MKKILSLVLVLLLVVSALSVSVFSADEKAYITLEREKLKGIANAEQIVSIDIHLPLTHISAVISIDRMFPSTFVHVHLLCLYFFQKLSISFHEDIRVNVSLVITDGSIGLVS